jgi:hypothetical protein
MSSQSLSARPQRKHLVLHRETVRNLHAEIRALDGFAPSDQNCSKTNCNTTK